MSGTFAFLSLFALQRLLQGNLRLLRGRAGGQQTFLRLDIIRNRPAAGFLSRIRRIAETLFLLAASMG
jgi:hypothetical protein